MMPRSHTEWDWPPTRKSRRDEPIDEERHDEPDAPNLEGRIVRERVEFIPPRRRTGWGSPGVTKAFDVYSRAIVETVKFLIAIPVVAMVIASLWLMLVLLKLV